MALGLPSTSFGLGQVFRRSGVEEGAGAAEPSLAPSAPKITARMLWDQFRLDVQGKEVQRAATYSYTWLADQVGHICLGILLDFGFTVITYRLGGWLGWPTLWAEFLGFFLTMAVGAFLGYPAFLNDRGGGAGAVPLARPPPPE